MAKRVAESKSEGADEEMERIMHETMRQQQAVDKVIVVKVAPPSCHYETLVKRMVEMGAEKEGDEPVMLCMSSTKEQMKA